MFKSKRFLFFHCYCPSDPYYKSTILTKPQYSNDGVYSETSRFYQKKLSKT